MTGTEYAALRSELGLSQQELAILLGLSVATISRREQGHNPIDTEAEKALYRVRDELRATAEGEKE